MPLLYVFDNKKYNRSEFDMGGNEVLAGIEKEKLIVIFRGVPTEDAADVARALADGGVKFIEITYNHCKG